MYRCIAPKIEFAGKWWYLEKIGDHLILRSSVDPSDDDGYCDLLIAAYNMKATVLTNGDIQEAEIW